MKKWCGNKIQDMLFYVSYILYFVSRYMEYIFLNIANIDKFIGYTKKISYVVCIIVIVLNIREKIFSNTREKIIVNFKRIIAYVIVALVIGYQVVMHNANAIFIVILFSVAFDKRDLNQFLTINYRLHIVCYLITIVGSFIGLTNNNVTYTDKYNTTFIRYSLGFNYPGQLLMSLIPIVLLYYYLNRERISWKKNLVWAIIIIGIFIFSQTIMPLVLLMLFILIFNVQLKFKCCKGIPAWITPIVCCIVCILLIFLKRSNNCVGVFVDNVSNYRFSLAVTAYDKYGVTLLGSGFQNINDGHQYLILDSEYIFMLVSNGIVYSALAVALFSHLIYRTEKSKNRHIVLIYVLIAVYCIFNNGIYNLIFNPFIILISRLEEKSCKSQGENEG